MTAGNLCLKVLYVVTRVVERLAREGDLVLGRAQFLADLHHVLVGLQIRVGLGQREQAAERAGEDTFR